MFNSPATNFVMIVLFGGMILAGMIAIIGGFLHSRRERLLTHAERMKAMELGRELPEDPATAKLKATLASQEKPEEKAEKSLPAQCFTTTGWVAGLGMFFACASGSGPMGVPAGIAIAVAASAGAIGVTGMICGTILATKIPAPAPISTPTPALALSKPRFDPEAV